MFSFFLIFTFPKILCERKGKESIVLGLGYKLKMFRNCEKCQDFHAIYNQHHGVFHNILTEIDANWRSLQIIASDACVSVCLQCRDVSAPIHVEGVYAYLYFWNIFHAILWSFIASFLLFVLNFSKNSNETHMDTVVYVVQYAHYCEDALHHLSTHFI